LLIFVGLAIKVLSSMAVAV